MSVSPKIVEVSPLGFGEEVARAVARADDVEIDDSQRLPDLMKEPSELPPLDDFPEPLPTDD